MFLAGACACNFLDIVPPEQAKLKDATKNKDAALGFLHSCYAGIQNPYNYSTVEASSDEWVLPLLWGESAQKICWGENTAANIADGWRWGTYYRYIGQCLLAKQEFLKAKNLDENDVKKWCVELDFLIAYYHMQVLILYGPCPITDHYIAQNTPENLFPGRSHFDYVVKWICDKFDAVANSGLLEPDSYSDDEWGRATSIMAKALKARLLLYAASPLWNGEFPFREWKNKNYETPGYGYDLVSLEKNPEKWVAAKNACEEAKEAALKAGYKLFDIEDSEKLREQNKISLPYVPFKDENSGVSGDQDREFKKRVMLMRYVVTTRYNEGNREIIWGIANQGNFINGILPHRVIKNNNGNWESGYSGVSPTLNILSKFYTENGEIPAKDDNFYREEEYYQRAGISDANPLRKEIIKFNTKREPRFYAWFAFDGGDMGSKLKEGNPLTIDLKNPEMHGFNSDLFNRDNNVTGFYCQKFLEPNFAWNKSGRATEAKPRILIRLAELYLNLAECYAELGYNHEAIEELNVIRRRAGIRELTMDDLTKMSALEWVRNERTVELWGEGHRYYDVRRWMIAKDVMGAGVRKGLNATVKGPSFEEFNKPVEVNQPFKWYDRMYLLPLFHNEVYKNPQFVQAPGY